ncbi:hypothetical protein BX666DRAFT_498730 [Dichotomocladium elegans]|nr:hypothetical protein BX666DRAFT_498730 [Dichotomocladium elegans]
MAWRGGSTSIFAGFPNSFLLDLPDMTSRNGRSSLSSHRDCTDDVSGPLSQPPQRLPPQILPSQQRQRQQHQHQHQHQQHNQRQQQPPGSNLFELVDAHGKAIHGRITLDNVYQNGLHALKEFMIHNLTDQRILVKMRSNLRNQISFQLQNENVNDVPKGILSEIATNTVEWSKLESSSQHYHHFNQLFNFVNHIDQLELEPHQTCPVILGFLPETRSWEDIDALTGEKNGTDPASLVRDSGFNAVPDDPAEVMYDVSNVTGSLFFFGYLLDYTEDECIAATGDESDEDVDQKQDMVVTTAPAPATLAAQYQISVKFRASLCRSVMWTDVVEEGLNFEDCMLGQEYYKDFTIQNNSDIDLYWLLNTVDLSNLNREGWLCFKDAETGEPLLDNLQEPIPGHSHRRVRLTFTPKEVGDFNYDLQIENANDARNVVQTKVHAVVRSVLREESLIVVSGTTLDFGDCTSGQWTTRQIVLNNVGESSVEVRFIPESAEVVFDIKALSLDPADEFRKDEFSEKNNIMQQLPAHQSPGRSPTNLITTPTATIATPSEVSGQTSEVSSRSTSPALSAPTARFLEHEGSQSPSSQDSTYRIGGTRILAPTPRTVEEQSKTHSDIGNVANKSGELDYQGNAVSTSDPNAPSMAMGGGSYTRIEDLLLRPGKERVIQVSYRPRKDTSINDFNAGQLIRRNFRVVLEYGNYRSADPKERKVIQCRARTCTSFVEVIPNEVNFGDTDVGTLKSLPINIYNRSDIIARVELQFSSKVLNCLEGEIVIQPRSYVELKLDLYPRKVNPEYRKQITLVNYLNRDNDQIIGVQSTNIDKNRVTFHSLFYRILTTTGANFLDFGSIVLNSPSIRTFTVENIRSAPLRLEVKTSMPDDIIVYTKKRRTEPYPPTSEQKQERQSGKQQQQQQQQQQHKLETPVSRQQNRTVATQAKISQRATSSLQEKTLVVGKPALQKPSFSGENMPFPTLHRVRRSSNRSLPDTPSTAYLDLAISRHTTPTRRKHIIFKNANKSLLMQTAHMNRLLNHTRVNAKENILERQTKTGKHGKQQLHLQQKQKQHMGAKGPVRANATSILNGSSGLQRDDSFDGCENIKSKRSLGITAARYKSRKNLDWSDIAGKSRVPFEDLISVLEHGSKASTPLFPKQAAEERFVRQQLAWRRELDRLIEKGDLVRTELIDVEAQGEEEVVIVFTPNGLTKPHIQSAPKKQDARIFLRLVDFDRNIEQAEFESLLYGDQSSIPVREVIIRAQLCRSIMDLGQKNINFGLVERNERHAKSIVLHNRSETPLLYAIRKSGSIASGDIILGAGRYGAVRAFGKREIDFVFEPTLAGQFIERLIVENIRDRTNDQVLQLKAMVRKPSTFFVKSLELSFGPCLVDRPCERVQQIVITNTNAKQSRLFEVRVDPNEANFGQYYGEFDFVVEDGDSNKALSKEAEEEIENLEQKLKIAKRKGQPDKIKKYLKKLAKLRNIEMRDDTETAAKPSATSPAGAPESKEGNEDQPASGGAGDDKNAGGEEGVKESNIYKKTAESVVFPLDPNATKTISVYFKLVARPIQSGSPVTEARHCIQGQILAHEYKNTDACKHIVYTAVICEDEAAYNEALQSEALQEGSQNLGATAALALENGRTGNNERLKARGFQDTVLPSEIDEQQSEPLKLERSYFDGGRVEVNQKSPFYVRVSNESDESVDYEVLLGPDEKDFFICPEDITEPLAPHETRKLMFEILPTRTGKQQHTLCLCNKRTGVRQTFTLQCIVHQKTYLQFPSLSADGNSGELDLGFSYVDPGSKYSQVTPLLVENVSGQDVYISSQSNLSHQVLIFVDETGERGLVDMMPFKAGSMTTVWVAVQPNLLTGYLGGPGGGGDECRELVGGIKFSVYAQQEDDEGEEMLLMLTQTVKFVSVIGLSHLEVSDRVINLGYTDQLHEEFYGSFTIKNMSGQLPLDYEVECPNGHILLDRRGGTLNGWRNTRRNSCKESSASSLDDLDLHRDSTVASAAALTKRDSTCDDGLFPTMSVALITFRISAHRYGLLTEKLLVTNKHNSQEVFEIEVRFFVSNNRLDAWATGTGIADNGVPKRRLLSAYHHKQDQRLEQDEDQERGQEHEEECGGDEHHREADPLPVVEWESIYVCPVANKSNSSNSHPSALQVMSLLDQDEARLHVRELEVANMSDRPMQLIALSDIDITAGWVADEDQVMMAYAGEEGTYLQRSGQLVLSPKQHVQVRLQCPSAEKLSPEDRERAAQGRSGVLKGMLILYDVREKVEVLAVELRAVFCVSLGELVVDRIDLGQIGHTASWKPVKFNFAIRNVAEVPLQYEVQRPEYMSFLPSTATVKAGKSVTIQGTLDPRKLHDQTSEQRRFDVRIANHYNYNNTMHLRLKALMTVFELCFDRLTDDHMLELPPLYHPMSTNVPCDNWFVIRNTTDDDIRFEIGHEIADDLAEYYRLDVLSRYTNTPLKGGISLSPQGQMEIRVRAMPNETSRLPKDRPDLLDPEGIILAMLWVTTRPINEEDHNQLRETIPVRGQLVEAPTFTLSERRLDFELVTYYQEHQDHGYPQQHQQEEHSAFDSHDIVSAIEEDDGEIVEAVCRPESLSLTILNQSQKLPLQFKVTIEGPEEFSACDNMVEIRPLKEDGTGLVEAGGNLTLEIRIANPRDSIPGQIRIHVDDLDAVGRIRQTASMYVKETVWDL